MNPIELHYDSDLYVEDLLRRVSNFLCDTPLQQTLDIVISAPDGDAHDEWAACVYFRRK